MFQQQKQNTKKKYVPIKRTSRPKQCQTSFLIGGRNDLNDREQSHHHITLLFHYTEFSRFVTNISKHETDVAFPFSETEIFHTSIYINLNLIINEIKK